MALPSLTGWWGVVLEAPDASALARFYAELLGWSVTHEDDTDATMARRRCGVHRVPDLPGVRRARLAGSGGAPTDDDALDVGVADLEAAVADAIELGARIADHQPQDTVRVMLDPAGHPFCLYLDVEDPEASE